MADQEDKLDLLERQFPAAGSAFATARDRVFASRYSVLQSEHGYICEVFPDGRRVVAKEIESPTPVVPGRKITIW